MSEAGQKIVGSWFVVVGERGCGLVYGVKLAKTKGPVASISAGFFLGSPLGMGKIDKICNR